MSHLDCMRKLTPQRFRVRQLPVLLAILGALMLLWETPIVAPLRLIVVFFHELSHALAALATGGSIVGIQLAADGSGLCTTRGGSRFLILSAGYLGSLLWGGIILVLAARSRRDSVLVALAGTLLVLVTVLFIRPFQGFGFISSFACGAVLMASARWLPPGFNDLLLKVIGLTSCFYVVLDLKDIVFWRVGPESDAHRLGELTGIPTTLWALLWMALAIVGALGFLALAASAPPETREPTREPARGIGKK